MTPEQRPRRQIEYRIMNAEHRSSMPSTFVIRCSFYPLSSGMIYIRCTQKLLKRMKGPDFLPDSEDEPTSDGRLGEWYANVKSLPFRGKSVGIFFNVNSYLTIFVPGNGTRKMLPEFVDRTGRLLEKLDVPQHLIDEEMETMQEIHLLKTASRSILGSMTDVAHHLDATIDYHRISSAEQMDWDRQEMILTEHIFGAINRRMSERVTFPKDLVKRIFEM